MLYDSIYTILIIVGYLDSKCCNVYLKDCPKTITIDIADDCTPQAEDRMFQIKLHDITANGVPGGNYISETVTIMHDKGKYCKTDSLI